MANHQLPVNDQNEKVFPNGQGKMARVLDFSQEEMDQFFQLTGIFSSLPFAVELIEGSGHITNSTVEEHPGDDWELKSPIASTTGGEPLPDYLKPISLETLPGINSLASEFQYHDTMNYVRGTTQDFVSQDANTQELNTHGMNTNKFTLFNSSDTTLYSANIPLSQVHLSEEVDLLGLSPDLPGLQTPRFSQPLSYANKMFLEPRAQQVPGYDLKGFNLGTSTKERESEVPLSKVACYGNNLQTSDIKSHDIQLQTQIRYSQVPEISILDNSQDFRNESDIFIPDDSGQWGCALRSKSKLPPISDNFNGTTMFHEHTGLPIPRILPPLEAHSVHGLQSEVVQSNEFSEHQTDSSSIHSNQIERITGIHDKRYQESENAQETYSTISQGLPSLESRISQQMTSSTRKGDKLAKPIHSKFQPHSFVTLSMSSVQCLGVILEYHGYKGRIYKTVINMNIANVASVPHDSQERKKLAVCIFNACCTPEAIVEGQTPDGPPGLSFSVVSGALQRQIHFREIDELTDSVSFITYERLPKFDINNPYEPQYYRYELSQDGKQIPESKCGLCAFCPLVKFKPFKNSSYLSHLTLEHGVFANGFLIPEALYYGDYQFIRSRQDMKYRKAVQCPACLAVVELSCWKNKSNPLLSYFRHFKKKHQKLVRSFVRSTIDPVEVRNKSFG